MSQSDKNSDKRSGPAPAAQEVVRARLRQLVFSGALRKLQARHTGTLMELFEDAESVPLTRVAAALFPDAASTATALANFRKFRPRFNAMLAENAVPLDLFCPPDKSPVASKRVWFVDLDETDSAVRSAVREVRAAAQKEFARDAAADLFVDINVRTRGIPFVLFPEYMDAFCRWAFPEQWEAMHANDRAFFLGLGSKLEPIRRVSPHPATPHEVAGFEILAIDEAGRPFGAIEQFAKSRGFEPPMYLLALLFAGLLSIKHISATLPFHDADIDLKNIFFTMNLDPRVVRHPVLRRICSRWRALFPDKFYFEIKETFPRDLVDAALEFKTEFGFSFALDDLDEFDPAVRRAFEPHASVTKIGYKRSRPLLDALHERPDWVLEQVRNFKLPGCPLVVEALAEDVRQALLSVLWRDEWGELMAQGRDLDAGPFFGRHLDELRRYGFDGGGFFLSTRKLDEFDLSMALAAWRACMLVKEVTRIGDYGVIVFIGMDKHARELRIGYWRPSAAAPPQRDAEGRLVLPEALRDTEIVVVPDGAAYAAPSNVIPMSGLEALLSAKAEELRGPDPGAPESCEISPEAREARERCICDFTRLEAEMPAHGAATERALVSDGLNFLLRWSGVLKDTEDRLDERFPAALALLGDTGSGKTTLCRRFAAELLRAADLDPAVPAPLYLDLARLAPHIAPAFRSAPLPDIVRLLDIAARARVLPFNPPDAIIEAILTGKVLLILDGFDAVARHLPRSAVRAFSSSLFRGAVEDRRAHVIITCRTHFFLDRDDERFKIACSDDPGARPDPATGPMFAYLEPFNGDQVRVFIEKRKGQQEAEAVERNLGSVPGLAELASVPFWLDAAIASARRLADAARSGAGAEFFGRLIRAMLARDESRHRLRPDIKLELLERLALRLMTLPRPALHYEELYGWFRRSAAMEFPTVNSDFAVEAMDLDFRAASFLVRDEKGEYAFAAEALLHYFIARGIARSLRDGDDEPLYHAPLPDAVLRQTAEMLKPPPFDPVAAERQARLSVDSGRNNPLDINMLTLTKYMLG